MYQIQNLQLVQKPSKQLDKKLEQLDGLIDDFKSNLNYQVDINKEDYEKFIGKLKSTYNHYLILKKQLEVDYIKGENYAPTALNLMLAAVDSLNAYLTTVQNYKLNNNSLKSEDIDTALTQLLDSTQKLHKAVKPSLLRTCLDFTLVLVGIMTFLFGLPHGNAPLSALGVAMFAAGVHNLYKDRNMQTFAVADCTHTLAKQASTLFQLKPQKETRHTQSNPEVFKRYSIYPA